MRSFFDFLTRTALRFRYITFAIVILVMILGGVAATQLQQELLPPIEFPQSFVLVQVSGMSSDQVLNDVTIPVEEALIGVNGVVNIESTTTSSIIALQVSTQFGLEQDIIRADMQAALDALPFPARVIQAAEGEDSQAFAKQLVADMTPDVLLYLSNTNRNFLFQLSPEFWSALSDDTAKTLLAYLAGTLEETTSNRSALEQIVDSEIVPQLSSLDLVARISVNGGQALPGDEASALTQTVEETESKALIYQLSPDVWSVIASRFGLGDLNQATIDELSADNVTIPQDAPALPETWQMDHFKDASDLNEMVSLTRDMATVMNGFLDTGVIRGSLAMTDDLTPESVQTMLDIDPTLASAFEAEQLAALPPEILDLLPADLELDGFTRDALASSTLARDLTGSNVLPDPVALPPAWRMNPPQIITFSFADLPLATFSVFSTAVPETSPASDTTELASDTSSENTDTTASDASGAPSFAIDLNPEYADAPEGPALPALYAFFGDQFGYEMNTADDLLKMQFPSELAPLLGGTDGAAFINLLPQLSQFAAMMGGGDAGGTGGFDASSMAQLTPALSECNIGIASLLGGNLDPIANGMISCLNSDVMAYLVQQDPNFGRKLSPAVYAHLSPDVLAIDGYAPPLAEAWDTLAGRPEFADRPLQNADDLLSWGNGSAAEFLNNLNALVPERFAGYEIRLFDSLDAQILAYIVNQEPDFYSKLDANVLLKFSPESLAAIPEETLAELPENVVTDIKAIASGEVESAAATIASEYASDIPPADDTAPALNSEWKQLESFFTGTEFNNAYDLIRFSDAGLIKGPPAVFINGFFNTANGAGFAAGALGNFPYDAFYYLADHDDTFIDTLIPRALNLLPEDIFNDLPDSAKERAAAGEVFVPSHAVTRTNGAPSLLVTIYKLTDANTVQAYHQAQDVIAEINDANPDISVQVAFEQASFIEESISGVVLSGLLGAFFAIVNILIFLSGDVWNRGNRTKVGVVVLIIAGILMAIYYMNRGSVQAMVQKDTVQIFFLIAFTLGGGLFILTWPGRLPYPSWRSTLVIAVSIPLSIMSALALMNWLPGIMHGLLGAYKSNPVASFLLRLAPEGLTLNIMTLSGLTVAVGRLVDDSIVVLENIFRTLQSGNMSKREAVLYATRDVSVAVFSATSIAVLVFLPLGLTGGLIAEFFLPFGIAVTYTLLSSYLVAITVVPALTYTIISAEHMPKEEETWMQRYYEPMLSWILSTNIRRWTVVILAVLSVGLSVYLFGQRPASFLPEMGEPQITIDVEMAGGTGIIDTNDRILQVEDIISNVIPADDLTTVRTTIGSGGLGLETLFGGGGVSENIANIAISVKTSENIPTYESQLKEQIPPLFSGDDESVKIASSTLSSGGFGGFELVLSGADQATLEQYDAQVIEVLDSLPELSNVSSTLTANGGAAAATGGQTYIRVCSDSNCSPALTYKGELDTEDVINFTKRAIDAVNTEIDFPEGVSIGQGFSSELQSEGFSSIFVAMGIAAIMIVLILLIVFRSPVYWLAVFFSVIVAPVGAAIALTVTNRVLGISSLIGLLMLLGLVVTNAIVLIDRVRSNRTERGMGLHDALVEAGGRRLRPILMTALTTIVGLIPLALGLSEGAIIAAELGTVVIGGIISSTLLMLIVVPSAYYLFTPLHDFLVNLFGTSKND